MSTLKIEEIETLAEYLENAELNAQAVKKITDQYPEIDYDDAYDIQYAIRRRKETRGIRITGLKMGLTSFAKMKQMGVDTPIYAFLPDYFSCPDGGNIDTKKLIHPRVEAELAFMTKTPLRGPDCQIEDVLVATNFVMPAIEVVDSRYESGQFDLRSVIADNASSSRFIAGSHTAPPADVDMKAISFVMEKNGEAVETATGASVLGHPAASVAMLANMLAERDEEIPAGTFIMTGGVTPAINVKAGDVIQVHCQGLGTVSVQFT